MNPEPQGYQQMIQNKLEPEIFSWRIYKEFISVLSEINILEPYPIHIKIDTGMHRLGFELDDISELIDSIKLNSKIKIQSIFSHLATSDDPEKVIYTNRQISIFEDACELIEAKIDYPIIKHILNSAGITAFAHAQYDMVRLGIGLYGVSPFKSHQDSLEVVSELKTTVSQIKRLKVGDAVGYGRNEIAVKPMQSATVPIGYADGLPRLIGNRKGYLLVNGCRAPIIGNVCMDMTMLDVTGLNVKEGDEVEIFGNVLPVSLIAQWADTIPYEIFTSISVRVKRVYFQE
jgi:alanine racemase